MLLKRFSLLLPMFAIAAAQAAAAPVAIAPGSLEVSVAVKATMHSFTATVAGGELAVTGDAATRTIDSAAYKFPWSGVTTGNKKRDAEMLEWVRADEHPYGVFTLRAIEQRDAGTVATGTLEFFGNSREIEFPVTIESVGAGLHVSGEATLDHRDWGLKQFRKLGLLSVNPTVTVRFKFEITGPS
jgi:polyisoprenoid-binding protein YceI